MHKVESTPSGSGAIRGQLNNSNATLYGSNPYFQIKTLLCPGMPFSHSAGSVAGSTTYFGMGVMRRYLR